MLGPDSRPMAEELLPQFARHLPFGWSRRHLSRVHIGILAKVHISIHLSYHVDTASIPRSYFMRHTGRGSVSTATRLKPPDAATASLTSNQTSYKYCKAFLHFHHPEVSPSNSVHLHLVLMFVIEPWQFLSAFHGQPCAKTDGLRSKRKLTQITSNHSHTP
jgi:hypothetical protein